jgi:CDP-diacylglycerol---serine O-phosphatidyltransferase
LSPEQQRPRRRRPLRPKLPVFPIRKAMFVLPNLFTISSIFCGFYAIVTASGDPGPEQLYQAGLAVFFGVFFDMADGRVARLTRTQSDFGVQLDSLADMVTFGVAPAVLVHKWGLSRLGLLGAFAAFTYVSCGALRLARFNVLAARSGGGGMKYFTGLPIPLAAGVLVSLVMVHQRTFAQPATRELNILALILVLSYLMVSNVRYRSFKDLKFSKKSLTIIFTVFLLLGLIAARIQPTFAVLAFFCGYVALGLIEEVIFFRKRRREDRDGKGAAVPPPPAAPPAQAQPNEQQPT